MMRLSKVVVLLASGSLVLLIINTIFLHSTSDDDRDAATINTKAEMERLKRLLSDSEQQKQRLMDISDRIKHYHERRQKGTHPTTTTKQSIPHPPQLNQPQDNDQLVDDDDDDDDDKDGILPILFFACNRPSVTKALDDLIRYRPSKEQFPIIVSQDCGHKPTSHAIDKYKDEILTHLRQPDLSPIESLTKAERIKYEGYYKVSRHYKFGLNQVFNVMKYKVVIIVEDDLNISPDFYSYFKSTLPILQQDPSLYCVSAWNDNGKQGLIEDNPELLYRSDFFPGLGWMMLSSLWQELEPKWPRGFWDDWLRDEAQRKDRACIRPEISRSHTFGEKGVSKGEDYKKHLRFIVLNSHAVEWEKQDLTYLIKENYDDVYINRVYSYPNIELSELRSRQTINSEAVRLTYTTKNSFAQIVTALNIMGNFKDGVPRGAYKGIVPIMYNSVRVYISPPSNWKGYDRSWH